MNLKLYLERFKFKLLNLTKLFCFRNSSVNIHKFLFRLKSYYVINTAKMQFQKSKKYNKIFSLKNSTFFLKRDNLIKKAFNFSN